MERSGIPVGLHGVRHDFILTEKILLSEQGQSSLAMPGNTTRKYWRTVKDPDVSGGVLE